jgi:hypothetical protein
MDNLVQNKNKDHQCDEAEDGRNKTRPKWPIGQVTPQAQWGCQSNFLNKTLIQNHHFKITITKIAITHTGWPRITLTQKVGANANFVSSVFDLIIILSWQQYF